MPEGDLGWAVYEAASLGVGGWLISSALAIAHRRWLPARGAGIVAFVAAASLAGAAGWYALVDLVDWAVGYPFSEPLAEGLFGRGMLYLILLCACHGAFLAARAAARAALAERLATEARLRALRYQLEPHFLVNALNSIVSLVDEDPARAQTVLTSLAGLLRRTLDDDAVSETPLERELGLIDRYLEIQRVRYEDKLRVEVKVAAGARRCAVPPLLVHALVENAVKHGLRTSTTTPVEIALAASYDGAALRVEVTNSGRLAPADGEGGIGLKNAVDRLRALYPGRHVFAVDERDGEVRATLEIRDPRVLA